LIQNFSGKSFEEMAKYEKMEGGSYEFTKEDSDKDTKWKSIIKMFNTITEVMEDFDVEQQGNI